MLPDDRSSFTRRHTFIPHYIVFTTIILAHMLDSLVRVSRRDDYNHFVRHLRYARAERGEERSEAKTTSGKAFFAVLCSPPLVCAVSHRGGPFSSFKAHPFFSLFKKVKGPFKIKHTLACNRFPCNDFRHSLTLFSKFFSSFLHSTCSLSVSRPYLALEGIYLLLRAAIPSNSTPRENIVRERHTRKHRITGLSPSLVSQSTLFQGTLMSILSR